MGPGRWDPPGIHLNPDGTANVALWAEGADAVDLCVFVDGAEMRLRLPDQTFEVFTATVRGMRPGMEYAFRVHGPWAPERGARWNAAKLVMDPYARAMTGDLRLDDAIFGHVGNELSDDDLVRDDTDSAPYVPRCVLVDSHFDWADDAPPGTAWSDTVIYEAHVRGLTRLHPQIPEPLQGTYAGLAHPAVLDHLRALGVTAIELLPVHHFVDETHLIRAGLTNYWGYNSLGYFAPHAGYASRGTHGEQVTEFKEMVKALHAAGIEVILDVVYNHTAEGSATGPTLAFRGIANTDYYHTFDGGRHYANYTGCGNSVNASSPRPMQMILDSLRYWVQEMHVDGFRFDLAVTLARSGDRVDMVGPFLAAVAADPVLRAVKLIAEPWDVGPDGYQVGKFPPPWNEWNGKYRDCVRDFWRGAASIGELGWRLTGSADLFTHDGRRPFASVNFVTAHDGFTLRDLVTYEHKHNEANGEANRDGTDDNRSANYGVEGETDDPVINDVRRRQMRNLLATVCLSTGVPMITAGDEFGRTQRGNNNAYCQDNEISWVDWHLEEWQRELFAFTRGVIAARRQHAAFRQHHFFVGQPVAGATVKDLTWVTAAGTEADDATWHDPLTQTIGMYFAGEQADVNERGERTHDVPLLLVLHAGADSAEFVLPAMAGGAAAFEVVLRTDAGPGEESPAVSTVLTAGTALALSGRSLVLLRGR